MSKYCFQIPLDFRKCSIFSTVQFHTVKLLSDVCSVVHIFSQQVEICMVVRIFACIIDFCTWNIAYAPFQCTICTWGPWSLLGKLHQPEGFDRSLPLSSTFPIVRFNSAEDIGNSKLQNCKKDIHLQECLCDCSTTKKMHLDFIVNFIY